MQVLQLLGQLAESAANPILRDIHEYILIFSKENIKEKKHLKENTITKEQFMDLQNPFGQ